jgi:hypothetical protein
VLHKNIHDAIETLEDDFLNRQEFAKQILARLKEDDCPSALGIYGGWGTGKTSLINLLKLLNQEKGANQLVIECIDAWKYEGTGDLFVPTIVKLMSKKANILPDKKEYLERVSKMLLYVVTDIALAQIARTSMENVQKAVQGSKDINPDHVSILDWEMLVDNVEDTQKAFTELAGMVQDAQGGRKLVFCIDNLDRCSPENTVRLLESIKNFLSVPGCIWVFAMDSGVVASYIYHKYEGTSVDSYSYLDKIIPEQYHLSIGDQLIPFVDNIFRPELQSQVYLDWESYAHIPRVLAPRRIIKSVRKFESYMQNPLVQHDANHNLVFKLILLYHSWPDFYEQFSCNLPDQIGKILLNFTDKLDTEESWKGCFKLATPLADRYKTDRELTYFLRQAFLAPGDQTKDTTFAPNETVNDISFAIRDLRKAGLP